MKTIPLTQNKVAIVDNKDFELASRFKWCAVKKTPIWYARCVMYIGKLSGKKINAQIFLHRLIMRPPANMQVDHINHNGLDCRRLNMRTCTNGQNKQNCRSHVNSSSRYKGVSWNKENNKWIAVINFEGRRIYLGLFVSEFEAAYAYDQAAMMCFGEFACVNFSGEECDNESTFFEHESESCAIIDREWMALEEDCCEEMSFSMQ